MVWDDVTKALDFQVSHMPLYRVIKEKRATFSCAPETLVNRPANKTVFKNLFLAGDYTDTGLPATIEGAILSGRKAAEMCM